MKKPYIILFSISIVSCKNVDQNSDTRFLDMKIPDNNPTEFKPNSIPNEKLIHRRIFNPNLDEYYYTLSDIHFKKFG
jgi:hypothetical protein